MVKKACFFAPRAALFALEKIGQLFVKIVGYFLDLYATKVCGLEIREKSEKPTARTPLIHRLIERSHAIVQANPQGALSRTPPNPYVSKPSHAALGVLGGVAIPARLALTMPAHNFGMMTTALTAQLAYKTVFVNLKVCMDPKFINRWHLAPVSLNSVDSLLYNAGIALVANTIDCIAYGKLSSPLHFAVAVAMFPPVQHAIVNTGRFKELSDLSKEVLNLARDRTVDLLSQKVGPYVEEAIDEIIRTGGKELQKMFTEPESIEQCGEAENPKQTTENPGMIEQGVAAIGRLLLQGAEELVLEEGGKALAEYKQKTTHKVACYIVDTSVKTTVIAGIELAKIMTINKATLALYSISPLAGTVGYVLGGGASQTVEQLALRIAGATFLVFTGSFFGATIIVYGPGIVRYGLTISGRYKRKKVQEDAPASKILIGLIHKTIGCGKYLILGNKSKANKELLAMEKSHALIVVHPKGSRPIPEKHRIVLQNLFRVIQMRSLQQSKTNPGIPENHRIVLRNLFKILELRSMQR